MSKEVQNEVEADENAQDVEQSSEETETQEADAADDSADESEEEGSESAPDAKQGKKNGFKKRVDRLKRRVAAAQDEAEYWRQQAFKGQANSKTQDDRASEPSKAARPKEEDYDTYEAYNEALIDWKVDQKSSEHAKERERQTEKSQNDQALRQASAVFKDRMEKFLDETEDAADAFDEASDIMFSNGVTRALMESDLGPQVMYELAKDKKEGLRISRLSDSAAIREIGRIEARVLASKPATQNKKTSKAPNPVSTVRGGASRTNTDPNKMAQEDYEKWRETNG